MLAPLAALIGEAIKSAPTSKGEASEQGWLSASCTQAEIHKHHRLADPSLLIAMELAEPMPVAISQPPICHLEQRWNLRVLSSVFKARGQTKILPNAAIL